VKPEVSRIHNKEVIPMEKSEKVCANCGGRSFAEGTDYERVRPMNKLLSLGSEKIYIFCLDCGYVRDIRIKNPEKFK
jgi:hypothetical protein